MEYLSSKLGAFSRSGQQRATLKCYCHLFRPYLLCWGCSIVIMFDRTAMLDVAFHWACSVDDLCVTYLCCRPTCISVGYISRVLCTKVTRQSISGLDILYTTRKISTSSARWRQHWSIRFRVVICAQKSLNSEVLNLKCTKELQHFASTKVLIVCKLDSLNANT